MSDPARKPGETQEGWLERILREAQEEGAFDHLAGAGKPLPLTGVLEEAWWIKAKLRREKLADLPEAIAIRLEAEQVLAEVARERDERRARERLEELDAKIRKINRTTISGPPTTLAPLDVDGILARWRAARGR
jgi:hypothetical protein